MDALTSEQEIFLINNDLNHRLQQMQRLMEINLTLTSTLELGQVLDLIILKAVEMLACEAGSILLYDREKNILSFSASTNPDHTPMASIPVPLKGSLAGAIFTSNQALIVNNVDHDPRHDTLVGKQVNFQTRSLLGVPMRIQERVTGVLEALNKKVGDFSREDEEILTAIASQAAVAIENAQLVQALQDAYDSTLEGWAAALDLRDRETEGHSRRVTDITLQLTAAMGIKDGIVHIRRGAMLHDIGKMAIPDSVLLKPTSLTAEETEIMRQHPGLAYTMLYPIAYLRPALDIPYCHHERWNGSGYPRGLKGEQIPLAARIFAVVDVWDALISDRHYRAAWPRGKVLAYLQERAEEDFDPQVVAVFLKMMGE